MARIWVCSDHHLSHGSLIHKFKRPDGSPARDFPNTLDHDELIMRNHNELVQPNDHVYFLGDFVMNRKYLDKATRMMGKKRLVRGNHDIFKTAEYIAVGFEEIYGVRVFPKHKIILSHIPLHPDCLKGRDWVNYHGHLHHNVVRDINGHPDARYRNVCLEHTDYKPVLLIE